MGAPEGSSTPQPALLEAARGGDGAACPGSDELHLMVGPVVLGGGTPLFGSRSPGGLRLVEARRFDGSDNLVLRYRTA
jgi:dihydrofolate reductase